jgi:hypothetical protein
MSDRKKAHIATVRSLSDAALAAECDRIDMEVLSLETALPADFDGESEQSQQIFGLLSDRNDVAAEMRHRGISVPKRVYAPSKSV